jgi:hypothetical protein
MLDAIYKWVACVPQLKRPDAFRNLINAGPCCGNDSHSLDHTASRRIEFPTWPYRGIGSDWSGEPAIFLNVVLSPGFRDDALLKSLASDLRLDLLRIVHAEDIGLHSYLNFVSKS